MRRLALSLALLFWLPAAPASAQDPIIAHDAVGCVVAGRFPKFLARLDPADRVARARVAFRAGGSASWYHVTMAREGGTFVGVLPKPGKKIKTLEYYIEAAGQDFSTARTESFAPAVVSGPGACRDDKLLAGSLGSASILLEASAGASAIPTGFSSAGVVSPAGAAGTASGGGGHALRTLGILGAAGAAGAAVALTRGKEDPVWVTSAYRGTTSQGVLFQMSVEDVTLRPPEEAEQVRQRWETSGPQAPALVRHAGFDFICGGGQLLAGQTLFEGSTGLPVVNGSFSGSYRAGSGETVTISGSFSTTGVSGVASTTFATAPGAVCAARPASVTFTAQRELLMTGR